MLSQMHKDSSGFLNFSWTKCVWYQTTFHDQEKKDSSLKQGTNGVIRF